MAKITLSNRVDKAFKGNKEQKIIENYLNQIYSNARRTEEELRKSVIRIFFLFLIFYLVFSASINELQWGPIKISDLNLLLKILPLLIAVSYYDLTTHICVQISLEKLIVRIFNSKYKPVRDMQLDYFLFPSCTPRYLDRINQGLYGDKILVKIHEFIYRPLEVAITISGMLGIYLITNICFTRFGSNDYVMRMIAIISYLLVIISILQLFIHTDINNWGEIQK